jgi:hypothetical protein
VAWQLLTTGHVGPLHASRALCGRRELQRLAPPRARPWLTSGCALRRQARGAAEAVVAETTTTQALADTTTTPPTFHLSHRSPHLRVWVLSQCDVGASASAWHHTAPLCHTAPKRRTVHVRRCQSPLFKSDPRTALLACKPTPAFPFDASLHWTSLAAVAPGETAPQVSCCLRQWSSSSGKAASTCSCHALIALL